MSAWVFLLLGGMDSIVFGPIRWCVWSFRPSSPLRLPHLKFLFVCYSGMNGKVVFSIPFLLDQEVILLRHSLLMDQVPVFLPMEPRLAPYGRPL